MTSTDRQIVFVTGASRGVGRGIASAFGEAGATVYVGGRTTEEGTAPSRMPGTIAETARLVTEAGGTGIPLRLDVTDDAQLTEAFARIESEQGRLDVLANTAWGGYERFTDGSDFNPGPFWEQPLGLWDSMHRAGLRAHYAASSLAAPLMVRAGKGLIVTLSSFAGQVFVPPVPYGVAHAAIDRLAADMAFDLRDQGVASIALYPGLVLTESVVANLQYFEHETNRETPLFVGRTVAALAADPDVLRLSGLALVAAEAAAAYGVRDEDGHLPSSNRQAITGAPTAAFPNPFDRPEGSTGSAGQ
ncbi:SDR family NAD(P)-dependent oxidoreductase [Arthrobacter zhaoguopingii]|uniref:SDR family NAD(P)-dependent oxidoreductase n=1 Tax=Arthrobacter zhaoguopingii TaxID=2681491 RepID=UPI0013568F31|nr:SDR family NAD(P)-dependent oxidoreductase [Arthrobacter zhaoguopingii]